MTRGHLTAAQERFIIQHCSASQVPGRAIGQFETVRTVAQYLKRAETCLFLGRGPLYPLALEAALKLKELSYIHAEGFAR